MREFFVPAATDEAQAEHVWQATRKFMRDQHGWRAVTERRIFRLDYLHDGKHMEAEVGKRHPYGLAPDWDAEPPPEEEREHVLVILEVEGGPYLVCTANRGVARGEPILVGSGEPYLVTYFDGYGHA